METLRLTQLDLPFETLKAVFMLPYLLSMLSESRRFLNAPNHSIVGLARKPSSKAAAFHTKPI